jgi:O-antigen/teichoic acid export membrane protein
LNFLGIASGRLRDVRVALRTAPESRTLKQSVAISSTLSMAAFAYQALLRVASTMVLTRLLTPDIFGVFSVVISVLYIIQMFSDIGIRSLILTRENGVDDVFLRCCWTLHIVRGALISGVILLAAVAIYVMQSHGVFPPESSYAAADLPFAVAVIATGVFILSIESPNRFVYERRMKFGKITLADVLTSTVSTTVTILIAYNMRSVWSLVASYIATACFQVALSFLLFHGPAMRPNWRREEVALIIARGKWIVSHSALSALTNMSDRLLLGVLMPADQFGFYNIARQIVELPVLLVSKIHSQIGLQIFTEFHTDKDYFLDRYYKYRLIIDAFTMLSCGGILVLAPTIVDIMYDARYESVAPMIQILALGLPLTGFVVLREAFSAQRRFREMTLLSVVQTIAIWGGLIVALAGFGSVTGALAVVALHRLPEAALLLRMSHREGWVDFLRELRLLPLIAAGAGAGWIVDLLVQAVRG